MTAWLQFAILLLAVPAYAQSESLSFKLDEPAEVIATVRAVCPRCDWGVSGREAVLMEITVDGAYSQHVVLARAEPAPYRIIVGRVDAGSHRIAVRRDDTRSSRDSGNAVIERLDVEAYDQRSPEYAWISEAPFLRARP